MSQAGLDRLHLAMAARESVKLMTTNHLTPEQVAAGGPVLAGRG